MTDTTHPLSTALSAILNSTQDTDTVLARDIVITLADADIIGRDHFADANQLVADAIGLTVRRALDLHITLSDSEMRLTAELAVNALRDAQLLVGPTT
jgi:hypothetical protein